MGQKPVRAVAAADVFDALAQEVTSLVSGEADKGRSMVIMAKLTSYMRQRRDLLRYLAERKETS